MANIGISASNDLYTISLDANDWTGLTVNGTTVSTNPDGSYTYQQSQSGSVQFVATADNLNIVNPNNVFVLTGPNNLHIGLITYSTTSAPGADPTTVQLNGTLFSVPNVGLQLGQGPFVFSQGMMTGTFSEASGTSAAVQAA